MIYVTITAVLLMFIFLLRLAWIKKEMRRLSAQVGRFHQGLSGKKVDIALLDKDIEELAGNINQLIDLAVQSNRDRIRSDRELRQAIANMSHDLRTPLTAIIGYTKLLEVSTVTDEKRQEYMSIIRATADRLHTLLHEFFELSLVQSTEYHLKLEPVQMNALLWEVLTGFYDQFIENQIEPDLQITDEPLIAEVDPSAVKRVFENLISNVIRHTTGTVAISLKENEGNILLIIKNQADNLSEQDIDKLFDRFYTADRSRSSRRTGLGLSIAYSLMLKMNGRLTARLQDGCLEMRCEWKRS
ncbi:Alkaline phosphatase synthesis sensor protein PhoR [Paenibacillus sp. GM2FR]|uniref:sensor histidine kinase n=1 Tax=Paenibacillus sp. GM2FR TaxID=2059268 RepID=UPI000C27C6E2|nr:HAMP domain-containing sensor histidine kinase [Paenibacillus sp. GM2FR]PJN55059.1 Alkaline phosphatase synthesis sensor protein PhoR [Paenibacillus sp. GM2FR]